MLGKKLSHYRIIKQIGAGGMGTVYEAEDTILNRKVAIKTLKDVGHQKTRLLREARAISQVNHPHIATIYDYGETDEGQPFIVMELITGQTLDEFLKNSYLNQLQIIDLIIDIAEAVSAAHQQGIIHRDIKPSNIIVQNKGKTVKVIDFGLSKQLFDNDINKQKFFTVDEFLATATREGVILGTPLYLSPEQATGGKATERSDIFSLGTLLYECLTGKSPFYAENVMEICANVIRHNPPPPSQLNSKIPLEIDSITLKALCKNQDQRYQTVDEFIDKLQFVKKSLPDEHEDITQPIFQTKTKDNYSFRQSFHDVLRYRYSHVFIFLAMLLLGSVSFIVWKYSTHNYQPSSNAEIWYKKGLDAFNDGAFFVAGKSFQRAIEQDPNFAMSYAKRAEALMELGYTADARDARARANEIAQNSQAVLSAADNMRLQGINETLSSDFDSAIKHYQQLSESGSIEEKTQAFLDLGRAYEKNEQVAEAIESYQKAISYNADLPSANLRLGILQGREQNFDQAFVFFDNAERIYKIQNNSEGEVEVSYQRGALLSSKGDAAKAEEEVNQALKKAEVNEIPYQQIKCLLLISRILRSSSRANEAAPFVSKAISLAQQNDINNLQAQGVLELGTVFLFQNNIPKAEESYVEALRLAGQYNATLIEKRALLQMGALKVYTHKADEALDYVNQIYKFFDEGKYQKDMLDLLSVKAQAVTIKGDFTTALKIYRELLERAGRVGDQVQKARTQKSIGTILANQDDFSEALAPTYESYAIYNSINKTFEAGYSLITYADILWQLGRYKEAEASLNQALGLAEKHPQLNPRINLSRAKMLLSERHFDEAVQILQKIINQNQGREKDVGVETEIVLALARIQNRQKIENLSQTAFDSEDKAVAANAFFIAAEENLLDKNLSNEALKNATKAQQLFSELKKTTLEWQAWLLICLAQRKLQNNSDANQAAARADLLFSTLSQKFTEVDFKTYSERPDVKFSRERLLNLSADFH